MLILIIKIKMLSIYVINNKYLYIPYLSAWSAKYHQGGDI